MRTRPRRSLLLRGAALTGAVFIACDSPFEPRGEGERVPIGVVIEGQARTDSLRSYSFAGSPAQLFVVFLEALQGGVVLYVYDSTRGPWVAGVNAFAGGPALEQNPSNTFGAAAGPVYRVAVQAALPGPTARFRFKVYAINTEPERVASSFSIGDTITGETIDPMVDLDRFQVHGVAGQEIVAVVEPQGVAGSGSVGLSVVDQVDNQFLAYVSNDAGAPARVTTGRMRLAGTHDYLFSFGSVISNGYPRYRGSYRFWTYLINRAPEHRGAAIPFDTEIGNERIDRAGDVDEFAFVANAGADFNAFVQSSSRGVQLEVAPPSGVSIAAAASQTSDTSLFAHATNRFQVTQAGTYVVRVSGAAPSFVADTGGYRVFLYAIDRRPEHVPQVIAPGDTVSGENIGLPGDIDEFTFPGAAGEEVNMFFQALNAGLLTQLHLQVVGPDSAVIGDVVSQGTDTSLTRQVTGRFALPATGSYLVRVAGLTSSTDRDVGPYRFFLGPVNRAPETVPDTLAFGDSTAGEAIAFPGDIDEWHVTVPDSSGANLVVQLGGDARDGALKVELLDSAGQAVASATAYTPDGLAGATGRIVIGPGRYTVRADPSLVQDRSLMTGSYRVILYRFMLGPEHVSDTIVVGDTIDSEDLEPPGDLDRFRLDGVRGEHINIAIQGTAAATPNAGFHAFLMTPTGFPVAMVGTPTSSTSLDGHQTLRVDLRVTGPYILDVNGTTSQLAEHGGYRLAVTHVPTAPEQAGASLVPGDSVTNESLDAPGDWDRFTVTATPGEELGLLFESTGTGVYPWIVASDPATGDSLEGTIGPVQRFAGPFRVPSGGQVRIDVFEVPSVAFRQCFDATCSGIFSFAGGYKFRVIRVNRAPESVTAAYAVGDTVRGESLDAPGDLDEFTSSGTPGETLTPFFRLTADAAPSGQIISLEVIDLTSGVTLRGENRTLAGPLQSFGSFTVPSSGAFLVRVRGTWSLGDGIGTAPYEFLIKR